MAAFPNKSIVMFSFGFIAYTLIEQFYRQYTFFWSGVLGGLSIILLDKINDEISWDLDLFWQAVIGGVIVTTMEFFVGFIAKYTNIFPVMWDYSNLPYNIDGIICLYFSLAWIALSVIAIFMADAINYYLFDDIIVPHYILFGKIKFSFPKRKDKND